MFQVWSTGMVSNHHPRRRELGSLVRKAKNSVNPTRAVLLSVLFTDICLVSGWLLAYGRWLHKYWINEWCFLEKKHICGSWRKWPLKSNFNVHRSNDRAVDWQMINTGFKMKLSLQWLPHWWICFWVFHLPHALWRYYWINYVINYFLFCEPQHVILFWGKTMEILQQR